MLELSSIGVLTAFAAGAISFLSPCVLPLVPAYVSYVAGASLNGPEDPSTTAKLPALGLSLFFVLGFSTVFVILGASATALGQLLLQYRYETNIVGGVIVIAFGLFMMGLLRLPWFQRELRFHTTIPGGRPLGAYVLGLAFAFGWTPCIGPVLATVLTLAANEASLGAGVRLLFVYSLGLGIPFILAAVAIRPFLSFLNRFRKYLGRVEMVMGLLLVATGVLILTGGLNWFGTWMLENVPVLGRIEELFTPKELQTDILREGAK
jgi:cytochrome c-type biogenesis protein